MTIRVKHSRPNVSVVGVSVSVSGRSVRWSRLRASRGTRNTAPSPPRPVVVCSVSGFVEGSLGEAGGGTAPVYLDAG